MTLIDAIKNWKNRREQRIAQDEADDNAPPRELRDRYLESLRRERQYQMNQDEKVMLKKKIAEYKKKKMAEMLYGIKDKREKEKAFLGNVSQNKVNVLSDNNNMLRAKSIMKQKSILSGNSLLNNRRDEFRKRRRY